MGGERREVVRRFISSRNRARSKAAKFPKRRLCRLDRHERHVVESLGVALLEGLPATTDLRLRQRSRKHDD